MSWHPGPLKHWLELNDSGVWGDDPTGVNDTVVLRSTDIRLEGGWSIDDPAIRSIIPSEGFAKRLGVGDLVVVKSSGSPEHLGKTAIVTPDVAQLNACFANFVQRLRPRRSADPRYVWYLLNSKTASDEMANLGNTTTGLRNLNGTIIGSVRFPGPPLGEQSAIADFLDRETARIDALIAAKRRMIDLLEERWRAAVVKRMTELSALRGTTPLKRMVVCLDGRRIPLSQEERATRRGPFAYYGASGVVDYIDSYLFDETLVLLGEDGAQLADPHYEIAFVVQGKCWVNNHAHVLRPSGSDPHFLAMHLMTFDRMAFISGSTREKITQDDMAAIPVPALSLNEQRKEAARLAAGRDAARRAVAAVSAQVDLLVEHRQALITAAVTGELAVPGVTA